MLNHLSTLYFKFVLKLFKKFLPLKESISHMIVTGSVAQNKSNLLKSDIDIILILKNDTDISSYLNTYKKYLRFISLISPHILPIRERLSNVYQESQLYSNIPSMLKGYLLNQPFLTIIGDKPQIKNCETSKILYLADKIKLLVDSNRNIDNKLLSISNHTKEEKPKNNTISLNHKKIVKINFLQSLYRPINYEIRNICFNYNNINELIYQTNIFYKKHPYINSVHTCHPWHIFIDNGIHVVHDVFFDTKETDNKILSTDQYLLDYYLKDFKDYKQSKNNDALNIHTLNLISNHIIQKNHDSEYKEYPLSQSISIIKNEDNELDDKMSLCICTKNREDSLFDLFCSISKQSKKPDEIIIINNGNVFSENYLAKISQSIKDVSIQIHNSKLYTISALRNFAISKASHEIISFVDDDCSLPSKWIENVYNHFNSDKELTLLGGVVVHQRQQINTINEAFHRSYLEERNLC